MKLIYLATGTALLAAPHSINHYFQTDLIERDQIEVIYLPNNTCHINVSPTIPLENYKDYVRACLNNRHLRQKIPIAASN